MVKVLRCRDVGIDCDFEVRAASEEEILEKTREHARRVHGMEEIPAALVTRVCAAIHDE
ncbi:MAG: DUF1059 domain-containing protein [Firmicutes bacterium]|nr:DUF1059 domain-containing protein [Bacillota bacterium]